MTGNADDLEDLETADVAYCLRIEGISTSFVSRPELADGTWLDDRTAQLECLRLPKFTIGINPATGNFQSTTTTFELEDVDGTTLVDLFASVRSDAEPLATTLEAGTTTTQPGPAAVYSKHVGIEYIGSAGQRMQYPAIPNYSIGYRHVGADQIGESGDVAATPVSAKPLVWAGRRAVLLRVFHNKPTAGTAMAGVNWTAPANSRICWFGTVLDAGQVHGKSWQIKCAGPESWLSKNIGQSSFITPAAVTDTTTSLESSSDYIGVWFETWDAGVVPVKYQYGEAKETITTSTLSGLRTHVTNAIATAIAATGPNGEFNDDADGDTYKKSASFSEATHNFSITTENNVNNYAGVMHVVAPEAVWARLGYLPGVQTGLDPTEDPLWVAFDQPANFDWPSGKDGNDGNYWHAVFTTVERGAWNGGGAIIGEADNGGSTRTYLPVYQSGALVLSAKPPFEIEITKPGGGEIALPGQHDAAPASDEDDVTAAYSIGDSVGTVDRTRLFAFFGPRRLANDWNDPENEVFQEYQVARCSWKDNSGSITQASTSAQARLVVHQWLDPRLFGADHGIMDNDWVGLTAPQDDSDEIQCIPLTHIGASDEGPDPLWESILACLVGTGTSTGHSSFYGDPNDTVDLGENEPSHDYEGQPTSTLDYETYSGVCCVPEERVQEPWEWKRAWLDLEPEVRRAKLAYVGRVPFEEIARGAMQALGMMWQLRDGKFGWFCPWDTISPDDAALAITSEDYAAGDRNEAAIPRQQLRVYSPIDRIRLNWSWNPVENDTAHESVWSATDYGAQYRVQNVERKLDGHGLRLGQNWETALRNRWKRGFDWWGRRHFKITGQKLQRVKGQDCWPGTLVRYTDQWAVNPDGTYSISNFAGFVTKTTYDCATETASVDFLIQEDGGQGLHYYAPIARVYHYDSTNYVLYCYDDMFNVGFGHNDVSWFSEPAWSSHGGSASLELLQFDGVSWTGGIYGTVTSVSAVAGQATIQLSGALTGGTFYTDKDTVVVVREYANQSATWCTQLFAGIANEDGEVNGSTANAVKFNG